MREWPRLTSAADLGPKRGGFADSRPRFSDTDFRDLRLARRTWPTWSSRLGSAVRRSEPIGGRVGRLRTAICSPLPVGDPRRRHSDANPHLALSLR